MPKKTQADYDALSPWQVEQRPKPRLDEVVELRKVIDAAEDERPIQSFVADNPRFFSPLLGGGHGRWVRPKVRFSDSFEADFMIADADSSGFHWIYVELESPSAKMFKANGEYADKARHAIFQIRSWRNFVNQNGDHARRRRSDGGLDLPHIRGKDRGLILLGRSATTGEDPADLRRQTEEDERITIHTYDWFLDRVEAIAVDPQNDHHPGGAFEISDREAKERMDLMHASPGADVYDGPSLVEPSELEPTELEPDEIEPDEYEPGDFEPA